MAVSYGKVKQVGGHLVGPRPGYMSVMGKLDGCQVGASLIDGVFISPWP